MGIGARTAGILAGLTIGLAAGVFLAALNPIVPQRPPREVATAPPPAADAPRVGQAEGQAAIAPEPAPPMADAPARPPRQSGAQPEPRLATEDSAPPARPGLARPPAAPETGVADPARRPELAGEGEQVALATPRPDRPAPRLAAPAPVREAEPEAAEPLAGVDSRTAPELALPEPAVPTEIGQGAAPESAPPPEVLAPAPERARPAPRALARPRLTDTPDAETPRAIARPQPPAPASGAPQVSAPDLPAEGLAGTAASPEAESAGISASPGAPAAPARQAAPRAPEAPAPGPAGEDLALLDRARESATPLAPGPAPALEQTVPDVAKPAPAAPEVAPKVVPEPISEPVAEAAPPGPSALPEAPAPLPSVQPPVEAEAEPEDAGETPRGRPVVSARLPTVNNAAPGGPRRIRLGQGGSARLPRIGASNAAPEEAAPSGPEPEAQPAAHAGALERNALPFEGGGGPLLSVVLLDDGTTLEKLDALAALGLPFAVAVPADAPDAALRAGAIRAAGLEVVAMAPRDVRFSLSGNQTRPQVAEALDAIFATVPQAIGLIDRPAATLQRDRRLAAYVVDRFAETGHGLVTYSGGLNAVPRLAAARAVPAAGVSEVLDPGRDPDLGPDAVAQALNRAAFEARSRGAAVVMMPPDARLLQALLDWLAGPRGKAVEPAPLSASLKTLAGG